MNLRASLALITGLFTSAAAQQPSGAGAPTSIAGIRAWDIAIVHRVQAMLDAPAKWNRSDASPCKRDSSSFSLRCALELATDEAAAAPAHATPATSSTLSCSLRSVGDHAEGTCGTLFDEASVFSIAPAKAIASGVWRKDAAPSAIWAGQMINPGEPLMTAARRLIDSVAPGKYRKARMAEFNDDPHVTFADLQGYLRALEGRVAGLSARDLSDGGEEVEIELYGPASGIVRTYNGWYPVANFASAGGGIRFTLDTARQVPPNALDREIIQRADAILSSDAVWNRADDRKCPEGAKTWSIYCALEQATREVTGGFHHRRPALELVRVIVDERTKDRDYDHRLMDYNNDRTTHLSDVRSLVAEALAKVPR